MRLSLALSLIIGLAAAALESTQPEGRDAPRKIRKRTLGVKKVTGEATMSLPNTPANAPEGYQTWITFLDDKHKRSVDSLSAIPTDVQRRRESIEILQRLRRQNPSDFYECATSGQGPKSSDCGIITSTVLASATDLIVAPASCLVFAFGSCQGFFCSLCSMLATSTDFIGSQLDLADALCVSNGQAGTIVAQDAPQWDAGYVRAGTGLPGYDLCH
ncbi:hypothetical protein B0H67DRAFT_649815 [Lasiosphaeris hirsuta]|uniref:Uncharacterized protein n=1 Tax=Lasiosphaeris hirsuta TaxID=260670 RepID=A0AA39ZXU3_9PEZI|nr:hypothetical protein B0H67DRAFT_649815 [Lasiosphaeris hirsuta]